MLEFDQITFQKEAGFFDFICGSVENIQNHWAEMNMKGGPGGGAEAGKGSGSVSSWDTDLGCSVAAFGVWSESQKCVGTEVGWKGGGSTIM